MAAPTLRPDIAAARTEARFSLGSGRELRQLEAMLSTDEMVELPAAADKEPGRQCCRPGFLLSGYFAAGSVVPARSPTAMSAVIPKTSTRTSSFR